MKALAPSRPAPLWFINGLVRIHVGGEETLDSEALASAAARVGIELLGPPGALPE